MIYFLLGALAFALWLNGAATYHLLRTQVYDRNQKIWQLFIIWLVPVFGALLILSVMSGSQPGKPGNEAPTGVVGTALGVIFLSSILTPNGRSEDAGDPQGTDVGGFDGGGH